MEAGDGADVNVDVDVDGDGSDAVDGEVGCVQCMHTYLRVRMLLLSERYVPG